MQFNPPASKRAKVLNTWTPKTAGCLLATTTSRHRPKEQTYPDRAQHRLPNLLPRQPHRPRLTLYTGASVALVPQATNDVADPPRSWKAKNIAFIAPAGAVSCTLLFQDPAALLPVHLERVVGTWIKAIDEHLFNRLRRAYRRRSPPLVSGDFMPAGVSGGPVLPVILVKPLDKDPLTGAPRCGNNFMRRWAGEVPTYINVMCETSSTRMASSRLR
jgi:hypothetical protein